MNRSIQSLLSVATLAAALEVAMAVTPGTAITSPAPAPTSVTDDIKRTLSERFGRTSIVSVNTTPIAGLYEVFTGDGIAYTDARADYIVEGRLLDVRNSRNVTNDRLDELNRIDVKALPLAKAIKTVHGAGSKTLYVFADPDCPYCQQLEKDLAGMDDLTVYTFLYPLTSVHPDARVKSRAIWCAPDRAKAWHDWMVDRQAPPTGACPEAVLDELAVLGKELRVQSTPTLYTAQGHRISGARRPEELTKLMSLSASVASGAASAPGK